MKKGFLLLEVLLTAVLFVFFASAGIVGIISAYNFSRTAEERVVATNFAQEGLEAMRSIRNQDYANLTNTTGTGVVRSGTGVWQYEGTASDTFGKYTRTITVEDVNRDVSGNIVTAPAGTLDANTKKITSMVTWNFSNALPLSVILSEYLNNWKAETTPSGVTIYSDGTTTPKYRNYYDENLGAETSVPTGATGRSFRVRTSPTKHEAIAGYVDNTGVLRVMCFDGTTWSSEWNATVGGTGTTVRFDIRYETTSGDVMFVYSRNAAATNAVNYRTKAGSTGCGTANWPAAGTIPTSTTQTTGVVGWIRAERSPVAGTDRIAIAWSDTNSRIGVAIWNGTAWGNQPAAVLATNLEYATAAGDSQSFDIAIESTTGNVMVVWGVLTTTTACTAANGNCIRYSRFTNTWTAATAIPTVADSATNVDLSANPNTAEMMLGAIDNGSVAANLDDMSVAYWSGSAWTGVANADAACGHPTAGTKMVSTGWITSSGNTKGILVYNDASNTTRVNYRTMIPGSPPTWSATLNFVAAPTFVNPKQWNEIQSDPVAQNQLTLTVSDVSGGNRFFAKQLEMNTDGSLTWGNTEGGAAIETALGQAIASPYSFAYWYK